MQSAADAIRLSTSEMNNAFGPAFARPSQALDLPASIEVHQDFERFPSPNEPDVKAEQDSPVLHHASTQLSNGSLVSPPDSTGNGPDLPKTAPSPDLNNTSPGLGGNIVTPSSASRHSSRQPKNVDRFVPDTFVAKSGNSRRAEDTHAPKQDRRASSSAASALTAVTDGSRRLSSNTSAMIDTFVVPASKSSIEVKAVDDRAGSTDSVAILDDGDERLARELHAQENGLRRRSTRA